MSRALRVVLLARGKRDRRGLQGSICVLEVTRFTEAPIMSANPGNHHDQSQHNDASGEPIRYPTYNVVGVLDTSNQLAAAVTDLTSGGFLESEISVAHGSDAADRVDATTGRGGITGLAIRVAQSLGLQNEESEFKDHYEEAMRSGQFVIRVAAPSDERKDRATEILKQHGAHSVTYYGKYTIQKLVPSNAP